MPDPSLPTYSPQIPWLAEHQALTQGVGYVDCSDRSQVELTGEDRAKFLHNLCSNEIKKLPAGGGCEAFLLNVKGHILNHGYVLATESTLVWDTVPGVAEDLLKHLDRYLIREKVELRDRGPERGQFIVAGAGSAKLLGQLLGSELPTELFSELDGSIIGRPVELRRTNLLGESSWRIDCSRDDLPAIREALTAAGAIACGREAYEAAQIEAGTPFYGVDVSDKNLPQEVNRDRLAINFNKGCYLGQETVARIDALGHVNRLLVGVQFESDRVPASGEKLKAGDQSVGEVTSTAWAPRLGRPLALAYVRRGSHLPGSKLTSDLGPAEVVALPLTGSPTEGEPPR